MPFLPRSPSLPEDRRLLLRRWVGEDPAPSLPELRVAEARCWRERRLEPQNGESNDAELGSVLGTAPAETVVLLELGNRHMMVC